MPTQTMPARNRCVALIVFMLLALGYSRANVGHASEETPRWIVVYPPAFKEAVEPLCKVRRAQGFDVVRLNIKSLSTEKPNPTRDGLALKKRLATLVAEAKGKSYALLVGDVSAPGAKTPPESIVPTLPGTIGRMRGLPSDNGLGCIDDDLLPDVAIGRFPVRNANEVATMVKKTIAFERQRTAGPDSLAWRKRIALLVGHPGGTNGFQRAIGARMVNGDISSAIARAHPYWDKQAVVHMDISPYCPPTSALRKCTIETLNQGQLLSIYLGHSGTKGFWSENTYSVTRDDFAKVAFHEASGVFLTCGCWACHKGGARGEGYGQAAIRNAKGPVAVVGAFGESYGALGKLALEGLLPILSSAAPPGRLGEWWLAIKAGLAHGEISKFKFMLYDRADGSGGKVPLDVQRREHLEMWMLLGDPALRLPLAPPTLALTVKGDASPGGTIEIEGTLPASLAGAKGEAPNVEIVFERPYGSTPAGVAPLPKAKGAVRDTALLKRWEAARNHVLSRTTATITSDSFRANVQLPTELPYKSLTIRVRALSTKSAAHGVHVLKIKVPEAVK